MKLKPWREVIVPHKDVLEGTFQASEFAADLTAVRTGRATPEYEDAKFFFERTFITEGMAKLLIQVSQRLNAKGGEPIIQLQTAFGGGKTHTMLAVYHLASRKYALKELPGIPELLQGAKIKDVPQATIAVLDGTALSPGQAWKHGNQTINTLWGELAWQLGGAEGYALIKESDVKGVSPGKEILRTLLEKFAPCVVLMDELVVYIRQFVDQHGLSGGTYESNLSFIQSLTEAAKLVPNAVILASLPESNSQAGGPAGASTLQALETVFNRIQTLWKTVAPEEAFEIVRRRLFEPISDVKMRDEVCKAFSKLYEVEGEQLPQETQESRYHERMVQSYPIHPEVFSQLYETWTTIEGFQRTRGVLKLMAQVIYRLWEDGNKDLMILPSSIPLSNNDVRNGLTYYLAQGWDPVIDRDIDGEGAETVLLENTETRFGSVQAARRVARTVFFGSAPSSVATKTGGVRGLDRAQILLGCLQPEQTSSLYLDALNRLSERLHYMSASGDRTMDTMRYWFDTRANLRREMEERKKRFEEKAEVRLKMAEVLSKVTHDAKLFDGVHTFTPHSDVPDDGALRLIILTPEQFYAKTEPRLAFEGVIDYVRNRGTAPRHRGNRLIFLVSDHSTLVRFQDCIRVALAWKSIVDDVEMMRLTLDNLQAQQARKELQAAENVLPRVARECYKWLLCPEQDSPTSTKPKVEAFLLNISGATLGSEIERVCKDNMLVITTWSPVHLREELKKYYWKPDKPAFSAMAFWEDSLRYIYLPRLKDQGVLEQTIITGADSRDFFGTACGQEGDKYDGFKLGDANVQLDDTLLLIEPKVAKAYETAYPVATLPGMVTPGEISIGEIPNESEVMRSKTMPKASLFVGNINVNAATAKMDLVKVADEVISVLEQDPNADVKVTLEIQAAFPNGVSDQTKRTITENARSLNFGLSNWE